jgi:hypothetical protein
LIEFALFKWQKKNQICKWISFVIIEEIASAKVGNLQKFWGKCRCKKMRMLLQKGFDPIVAFCMYVCNFATHLEVSFFCSPSERKIVFASKIS